MKSETIEITMTAEQAEEITQRGMEPFFQEVIRAIITDERLHAYGMPDRGTQASAGADLRAMLDITHPQVQCEEMYPIGMEIHPGQTVMIDTGLRIHIDNPCFAGLIMARSGLSAKQGLAPANKVGLIDSDYQGPLMVALHNHSNAIQFIEQGERIAQLVIVPVVPFALNEVDSFNVTTERGDGGFGSTGEV